MRAALVISVMFLGCNLFAQPRTALTRIEAAAAQGQFIIANSGLDGAWTSNIRFAGDTVLIVSNGGLAMDNAYLLNSGDSLLVWRGGKVYRRDASTLVSSIDIGGELSSRNVVYGSGIADYVARWVTDSTLGTGILRDDGSNVGVGTAPNASYAMTVNGDMAFTAIDQAFYASNGSYFSPYIDINQMHFSNPAGAIKFVKAPSTTVGVYNTSILSSNLLFEFSDNGLEVDNDFGVGDRTLFSDYNFTPRTASGSPFGTARTVVSSVRGIWEINSRANTGNAFWQMQNGADGSTVMSYDLVSQVGAGLTIQYGDLQIDGGGTFTYSITNNDTGAEKKASGTTPQRPTGTASLFRYNTDSTWFEGHNGTEWLLFAKNNQILWEESTLNGAGYIWPTSNRVLASPDGTWLQPNSYLQSRRLTVTKPSGGGNVGLVWMYDGSNLHTSIEAVSFKTVLRSERGGPDFTGFSFRDPDDNVILSMNSYGNGYTPATAVQDAFSADGNGSYFVHRRIQGDTAVTNLTGTGTTGGSLPSGTFSAMVIWKNSYNESMRTDAATETIDGATNTAINWTWDARADADEYDVYVLAVNGSHRYIATVSSNSYTLTDTAGLSNNSAIANGSKLYNIRLGGTGENWIRPPAGLTLDDEIYMPYISTGGTTDSTLVLDGDGRVYWTAGGGGAVEADNGAFTVGDTVKLGGDITRNTAIGNNLTSIQSTWLTIGAVDTTDLYLDTGTDQDWYGISLPGSNDVLRSVVMGSSISGNSVGRVAAGYLVSKIEYQRWDAAASHQQVVAQNGETQLNSVSDTAHVIAKTATSNTNSNAYFSAFYRDIAMESSVYTGFGIGDFNDVVGAQFNPVNDRIDKGFVIQSIFDAMQDTYFDWLSIDFSGSTDTTANAIEFYNGKYELLNEAPPEDGNPYVMAYTDGVPSWKANNYTSFNTYTSDPGTLSPSRGATWGIDNVTNGWTQTIGTGNLAAGDEFYIIMVNSDGNTQTLDVDGTGTGGFIRPSANGDLNPDDTEAFTGASHYLRLVWDGSNFWIFE